MKIFTPPWNGKPRLNVLYMPWMPSSPFTRRDVSNSVWTQQEIGFALGRDVQNYLIQDGRRPHRFISKHQALARGQRTAEQIALEIDKLLAGDEQTATKLAAAKRAMKPDSDDEISF